jgi:hypothetical protein
MPEPMTDPEGFLHCPACKRVQPKPQAGTQLSNYRCRDHPDEPVNFRGKGCRRCPTRKANKRTATEPSDDYEMETYQ